MPCKQNLYFVCRAFLMYNQLKLKKESLMTNEETQNGNSVIGSCRILHIMVYSLFIGVQLFKS